MSTTGAAFDSLSVIIPAYNAQSVVASTLDACAAYLARQDLDFEIIVVDDGSTDQTARLVAEHSGAVTMLRLERNRGKGAAVRLGVQAAQHAWVLYLDVDHSTAIDHLDSFAAHAADADILIGSRNLPESRIVLPQPWLRQTLGQTFPYLVRLLALPGIRDSQCGFKLFRREVARRVFDRLKCGGFCFDVEVLLCAKRLGYRMRELPVRWDNPTASTLRLWRDPARMLLDLLRIAWRHRRARYRRGKDERERKKG